MKRYWFLLEAYVFIWTNKSHIMCYNALSGKHCIFLIRKEIYRIVEQLLMEENAYCIELTEKDMHHPNVESFIKTLRDMFMGDLYDQSLCPQKPIVVYPSVSINEDFKNTIEGTNNLELFGQKILNNLDTVTIQLTGQCNLQCPFCNNIHKQTLWCNKNEEELNYHLLLDLLQQIDNSHIPHVNFIGGNILCYTNISTFLMNLDSYSFSQTFYINLHCLDNSECLSKFSDKRDIHFCLCADYHVKEDEIQRSLLLNLRNVKYCFIVASIEDFNKATKFIDKYQLKASIVPFYTNKNLSFFEEYVYLNLDDIKRFHRSKKEIFANQKINTNFFGRIFIASNGLVYSNMNMPSIGDVRENLSKLVYNEMKFGNSWHLTRDTSSHCKNCLYKYLCPSISNYELAIGKSNLCNQINESYK